MRGEWSITWDEYKELVYFCRQYARKRAEAESLLTLRISTPQPVTASDGSAEFLPHGSGGTSDPVAMIAEKRERLLADCQMIERAAQIAGGDVAPWLLKCVTDKGGVRAILADAPISERSIYRLRRKFFFVLHEMKVGRNFE